MRVRDVVRDVVAEVAPEELPLVDALSQFDDATVVYQLRLRRRRPEPLGFGVDAVHGVVTPIIWIVTSAAAGRIGGTAGDGLVKGLGSLVHKILRRHPAPVSIPPLTSAQLGEVRREALEAARRSGLSESRAEQIADALVAKLAAPSPGASPGQATSTGKIGKGAAAQGS